MYTYLALGDSYTIGEQVRMEENFPNQLVNLLNEQQIETAAPVIIAQTGWTTDELAAAIREHNITDSFSFVSLLIGVNNQYRGRSDEEFKTEFIDLLQQAINFAKGRPERVFVVSIPDWGVTPFATAEGRDPAQVAKEIDRFNQICEVEAKSAGANFLNITDSTRKNAATIGYLAPDNLHPSALEYTVWAERLAPLVKKVLKSG